MKFWNRFNWRWCLKQAADYTIAPNDATITLPFDFKDVYTARWETNPPRNLQAAYRRQYDRLYYDQSVTGPPIGYELFAQGDQGKMGLIPTSNMAGTIRLRYYRRMWVPCTLSSISVTTASNTTITGTALAGATVGSPIYGDASFTAGSYITALTDLNTGSSPNISATISTAASTTGTETVSVGGDGQILDIPEDQENGILAWACHHFLSALGAPESRLSYFIHLADSELQKALEANDTQEDLDICFTHDVSQPFNLMNPNATVV